MFIKGLKQLYIVIFGRENTISCVFLSESNNKNFAVVSLKCPYCSSQESKVIDKRTSETSDAIRRRRECLSCQNRFTTFERVERGDLRVIKKDGRREQFDRQKLVAGLIKACEKRPVTAEQIDEVVDKIEADLRKRGEQEIPSNTIGNILMKHLKKLDKVAYIRFASVYKDFADLEDFGREVNKLIKK